MNRGVVVFVRGVHALSLLCGIFAVLSTVAALVVVCEMVLVRYIFQTSTYWQTEFVTYAIVAATFLGSPYVLLTKGHISVDLLPARLHRARSLMTLLASALALGFCLLLAWYSWLYFFDALTQGWRTETVWRLPLWIPVLPLPVGMSLLALQYIADILRHVVEPTPY